VATSLLSFGAGMAVGAALWGGCNWGWGGGDVDVNVNNYNNFNKTNISNKNWEHRPEHRKGTQYRDKASQDRYGKGSRAGADSREAFRGRAEQGRKDIARTGADKMQRDMARQQPGGGSRPGGGDRPGSANRPGGAGRPGTGAANRPAQQPGGGRQQGPGGQQRPGGGGDYGRGGGGRDPSAFRDMGSGSAARRDSSRGYQSRQSAGMGGGRGGGGQRGGGGGRGGGGRGGGGRGGGRR
jgi:hypothetical protein